MAYTIRGRRVAFDNIAYASAAGRESTARGTSDWVSGPSEKYGGGSNIITAVGQTSPPEASSEPTSTNSRDNMYTASGDKTSTYINETIINTN